MNVNHHNPGSHTEPFRSDNQEYTGNQKSRQPDRGMDSNFAGFKFVGPVLFLGFSKNTTSVVFFE
jgi:hypothetical protein